LTLENIHVITVFIGIKDMNLNTDLYKRIFIVNEKKIINE